jgi:hypothetical protein
MGALQIRDGESLGTPGHLRVGAGLRMQTGTNEFFGTATLVNGTVTVANTAITADSVVFLTPQNEVDTPGFVSVTTRTPGVSFVIGSSTATDDSLVGWMIVEPFTS